MRGRTEAGVTPGAVASSTVDPTGGAAGGVARPLSTKLGEIVSVKDFGAKGDGTTNDTAAVLAAIAAAPTVGYGVRKVYFPPSPTEYVVNALSLNDAMGHVLLMGDPSGHFGSRIRIDAGCASGHGIDFAYDDFGWGGIRDLNIQLNTATAITSAVRFRGPNNDLACDDCYIEGNSKAGYALYISGTKAGGNVFGSYFRTRNLYTQGFTAYNVLLDELSGGFHLLMIGGNHNVATTGFLKSQATVTGNGSVLMIGTRVEFCDGKDLLYFDVNGEPHVRWYGGSISNGTPASVVRQHRADQLWGVIDCTYQLNPPYVYVNDTSSALNLSVAANIDLMLPVLIGPQQIKGSLTLSHSGSNTGQLDFKDTGANEHYQESNAGGAYQLYDAYNNKLAAFYYYGWIFNVPASSSDGLLSQVGDMRWHRNGDTALNIRVKGSDSTVRSGIVQIATPATVVGSTFGIDGSTSECFDLTANANATISAPTSLVPGKVYTFILRENATGGFTFTWNAAYVFATAWSNTGNTASKVSVQQMVALTATTMRQAAAQVAFAT